MIYVLNLALLLRQLNISIVMPDLIRHPGPFWIPAFAGMTALTYIVAGVIKTFKDSNNLNSFVNDIFLQKNICML